MPDIAAEEKKTEFSASSKRPLPAKPKSGAVRIVVLLVLLILLVAGYFIWSHMNAYESTDDAQNDGHINSISARISGQVIEVLTDDEKWVKAGDVLVRIDPKDYAVAVAKAEADLPDAEAALAGSRTDIPITSINTASQLQTAHSTRVDANASLIGSQRLLNALQARLDTALAQVREAEANYKNATDDVARYKQLVGKDEISRQQYDTSVTSAEAAKATLDARRAAVTEAQQNISVAQSAVEQANARISQAEATVQAALTAPQQVAVTKSRAESAQAQVAQKRALLDQAKLNVSYCTILAPVTGIVGKKTVETGQNISPGEQLMAVVPLDDIWVTADFKETQLRRIKQGQLVKFDVDAYHREYRGKVEGMGAPVVPASACSLPKMQPEITLRSYSAFRSVSISTQARMTTIACDPGCLSIPESTSNNRREYIWPKQPS